MTTNSFENFNVKEGSPFSDSSEPGIISTPKKTTTAQQFLPLVEELKSKSQAKRLNAQSRTTTSQKVEYNLNYLQFLIEFLHTEDLITPKTYKRAFDAIDVLQKHV